MAQAVAKKVTALHKGYQTRHKVRVVTAASLFDGHDASINIMRRILQASGAEVIHLGHLHLRSPDLLDACEPVGIFRMGYQLSYTDRSRS